jgi:hypothetical protein
VDYDEDNDQIVINVEKSEEKSQVGSESQSNEEDSASTDLSKKTKNNKN